MTKFSKMLLSALFFKFITLFLFSYQLEKSEVANFAAQGQSVKRIDVTSFFSNTPTSTHDSLWRCSIATNPIYLQKAAQDALGFFKNINKKNKIITNPEVFGKKVLSFEKTRQTLEFIINVIENDKKNKRKFRILDPNFLKQHFKFIKWSGDINSAKKNKVVNIPKGKIRLTEYAVFNMNGSYYKNKKHPYALYSIVDKNFIRKDRFKYTKQDVLTGILNEPKFKNKVKPLVWLSRQGLEEAIMQGTAIVKMPDKRQVVFTVSKNNGIVYDKHLKDRREQKRYWYFKGVKENRFGKEKAGVVFAGDLYNIGLGKIIAIKYRNNVTRRKEVRLGVLADSGGAFTNNLYQLDLFAGIFKSRWGFNLWKSHLPCFVEAYILAKR